MPPGHRLKKARFASPTWFSSNQLDPTIKLDIRYATSRNFLGAPLYLEPRAYMQRPAAEAVVRASQHLHVLGYGLLIHDSYRPWYVTKMFWRARHQRSASLSPILSRAAAQSRMRRGPDALRPEDR